MLTEKPRSGKHLQRIPKLFQEIIRNDAALKLTKASPVVSFGAFKQQRSDQLGFQKTAEEIYAGTKNKGKEI